MRQHQLLLLSIRKSFRGKKQSTSSSCQNLSSFIKSLIDLIFFLLHFLSQLLLIYKKNCTNYWIWHGLTFIIIVVLPTRAHKRKIKEFDQKIFYVCFCFRAISYVLFIFILFHEINGPPFSQWVVSSLETPD